MKNLPIKHLLLAGAGHAHIGLLRRLSEAQRANSAEAAQRLKVTLITEQPRTIYSGMLPGWLAGHYELDEISIDIAALCKQAGVHLTLDSIAKVDATHQTLVVTDGEPLNYDILSLNTGADTDMRWSQVATDQTTSSKKTQIIPSQIVPIRPLQQFIEQWQRIIEDAKQTTHYRLAIVGAGAAATELVMAAQFALRQINPNHQVYLVCGEHLLSGFTQGFRQRVIKQLERHTIKVVYARAVDYANGQLITSKNISQESFAIDAVIAATGVTGSAWTQHTDIKTVDNGFVAVDANQQSISHTTVFAVGDVATRVDQDMAHSGVHAVFGGAVEADNLWAYLADETLQSYQPKKRTLYLLSCGDKYAIASWGKLSMQGRWVWQLKRYIDRRFVNAK